MGTPNNGINGTLGTGLIGHWSFDNGSLLDESGNGNNLISMGTPLIQIIDKDGIANNALKTTSSSGYLQKDNLFTEAGNNNYTISILIEVVLGSEDKGVLATDNINFHASPFEIDVTYNGKIKFFANGGWSADYGVPIGWNHIIIGNGFIAINGIKTTTSKYITFGTTGNLYVGKGGQFTSYTRGFDELRIYNRTLTDSEIAELTLMGVNYTPIPKCETPVANPASGTYTEAQTVELTCSTPDSAIYYTTNGVDPDGNETLYTIPIEITENTILKAIAYAEGYDPSDILTEIYNIEGGNEKMEESQSAGLIVIGWTPEGDTKETILGEVPADGQEVLNIQETINYFKTKYAGEYPTEGRVVAGAATFTVDLIESPTLRSLLSNTSVVSGTKTIIGVNSGAKAKTGKLRLHPMYAGADKSEDITILRAAPAVTDERTYSADGKKLMKVVFTVMGVKTALGTPAATDFTAHMNTAGIKVKMANANDLGVSVASAAEDAINDATNVVTFTPGIGANRAIFFKSSDNFATAANTSYYEPTADEVKAGSFAPGTVTWKPLTALTEIPTEATGYYYKAIEIGV